VTLGANDDFARQRDIDRLDRAVEDLRVQMRDDGHRRDSLREADNAAHAAQHDAIEERIDKERQAAQRRGDSRWTRTLGVLTLVAGVATLCVTAWLSHH
jgi:hypothetical protein